MRCVCVPWSYAASDHHEFVRGCGDLRLQPLGPQAAQRLDADRRGYRWRRGHRRRQPDQWCKSVCRHASFPSGRRRLWAFQAAFHHHQRGRLARIPEAQAPHLRRFRSRARSLQVLQGDRRLAGRPRGGQERPEFAERYQPARLDTTDARIVRRRSRRGPPHHRFGFE